MGNFSTAMAAKIKKLARISQWWQILHCNAILSPYSDEMARLLGTSTKGVLSKRLNMAQKSAKIGGNSLC